MKPSEAVEGFILSAQQSGLWSSHAGAEQYALCAVLLEGELRRDALTKALRVVVGRQEILRTTFRRRPGMVKPFQVIGLGREVALDEREACGLSPREQEAAIEELLASERRRRFDLERGPVARFTLLRLAPARHALVVNVSPLCADDATLARLVAETFAAYADESGESLPEVALQYADFASWQEELFEGEDAEAGLAFWAGVAQSPATSLRGPASRAADAAADFNPQRVTRRIGAEAAARVNAAALRHDVPPEVFLLASWQTLLWRLTGRREVVVGSLFDGRKYEELAEGFGPFAKTLPVRCRFEGGQAFADVLVQVKRSYEEAFEWQEYFDRGRDAGASQPGAASSSPTCFEFVERPAPFEAAGLRLTHYRQEVCAERFELKLRCTRTPEQTLEVELHFDPAVFDAAGVERLAGQFETLLSGAAGVESRGPVSRLPLLCDAEREKVLGEFNRTAADYGDARCVHELFEEQAAREPARAAVVYEDESLTYEELNRRANQLAARLRQSGAGRGSLVAVLLGRSAEAFVGLLGVLKAGAAYVPLDPEYPAPRLRGMIEDAGVRVVVTREEFEGLTGEGVESVCLDRDRASLESLPAENVPAGATAGELAYVIFTSGSTGRPKGVGVEHRQLFNYIRAAGERADLPAGASYAAVTTFAADLGHTMIFPALCGGGTLHVVSHERARDAQALADYVTRHRVDCLKIVPSHLRALQMSERAAGLMPRLRLVLGGEASSWEFIEQLRSVAPEGCRIFNHYGPTETTVGAVACELKSEDAGPASDNVPLGRPLGNLRVYVLDRERLPVPVGATGEIYIAGEGVARGYVNRPELTAERFLPDPFAASAGGRMYRTGDLGRFLEDGRIEFLGRADNQVKYHGFRVELNELRSELNRHPRISESFVVLRKGKGGNDVLAAYYVSQRELPVSELREFLARNVIEETIPNAFIHLTRLPLTPNGKIDHEALPSADDARARGSRAVAPRTPAEQIVASIWADLLDLERVGADDNFFDLGGHSLLATQVVSRLREAFGVEVSLRDLFESPTVAGFSSSIEAAQKAGLGAVVPPIVAAAREGSLPLSFAQQRLWFIDQLNPGNHAYNVLGALRLRGRLDRDALERSLNEIVRRHESLRTRFVAVEGEPSQVINEPRRFALPLRDLGGLDESAREAEVLRRAREESRRPFDLSTGPLLRLELLGLADDEHVLIVSMHHIVSDGWSVGVFARELTALYAAHCEGRPSPLAELPVQYADYASWQRAWMRGEALERQTAYWRGQLEGLPELRLDTDRPRPEAQSYRGATHRRALPPELAGAVRALSRREGSTLFMTLLAAFQVLLHRYTGQDDIVVGTDIANRNRRETESLIGFFVNHPVLRVRLGGDPDFRETLRRVRDVTLGAYAHQDLPFEKLVGAARTERRLSHMPLFQVLMVLRNAPPEPLRLPGLSLDLLEIDNGTAKFDIALFFDEVGDDLVGKWNYSTDLFDAETIETMSAHFERLLAAVVANPGAKLSALDLSDLPSASPSLAAASATDGGDADAAAALYGGPGREFVAPRNAVERELAAVWSQVLGVERVSVHDNFFELGGDSIISIQIIAKANRAGLRLTPKQFFLRQTIAELAEVVEAALPATAEQGLVTGELPLTPVARRFFERELPEPDLFSQAVLLETDGPLEDEPLGQAVAQLLRHHDALRLRFERTPEGRRQVNAGDESHAPYASHDFASLADGPQREAVEAALRETQSSLGITDGPLVRVAQMRLGGGRALLFVAVHHLAVDVVSWRVLLEDLQTAYGQLSEGRAPELPAKTTSFKRWAERLTEGVRAGAFEADKAHWLGELRGRAPRLPLDFPGGTNSPASARAVTVELDAAQTRALLSEVPQVYHTQINDVLLTALARAFSARTLDGPLLVEMEGHGREEVFEDVDLSRTVGWFTTNFPVLLELGAQADAGSQLKRVKEKLRRIPSRGFSYGALRYLDAEASALWRELPRPEVSFNYLGQFEEGRGDSAALGRLVETRGAVEGMPGERTHLLEVDAKVVAGRLRAIWTYSESLHREETVAGLAREFVRALLDIITHCRSAEDGGFTPSDFPEAELSQEDLDGLFAALV